MISYMGVDSRADVIQDLTRQYPQARFVRADLDEDELPGDFEADTVLMVALVEHIFNQKHLMTQVRRCLAPSGRVILTTPTPFGNDVVHRAGGRLGLFSQIAVDDHVVIYNRPRLETLAREVGLKLVEYRRFQFGCNQLAVFTRAPES